MSAQKKKMENSRKVWMIMAVAAIVIVVVYGCIFYLRSYYHASQKALDAMRCVPNGTVTEEKDYYVFQGTGSADRGIIFYPGAKVEETAYAPLMENLMQAGYTVYLMRMPFHLAIFDVNAADQVIGQQKDIHEWYMMGHSLGGAMAARYTAEHPDQITGLVLLGAYSTADLSQTDVEVLSIYGSQDGVLNREKYETEKKNLPSDVTEYVIEGGNHAGYGNYGKQKGDGEAEIPKKEQQQEVIDQVIVMWGES